MFAALAATRFAHFAAICLLFGVAAFPFYAVEVAERPPRFRRALQACGLLAVVTGALELLAMAANMGDTWRSVFDTDLLVSAITDTNFGRVWAARLALAILVAGISLVPQPARSWPLLMTSGLLLASVALTGHSAIPGGSIGLIHQIADVVHLLAAGWWIGGLFALLLTARALGERTPAVLHRFSRIGYAAVTVIIASGVMKSLILVSPVSMLFTSRYGAMLLIKIALVAGMGLLALSNRFQITPALAAGLDKARWTTRLQRQIAAEFALAILILGVVGALGAMSPPVSQ